MDRDHCMYNVQWFIDKKYFTGSSMYNTGTGTTYSRYGDQVL